MYSRGIAQYYDLFADGRSQPDAASAFVVRIAGNGGAALDIGAGVGNTAFALAAAGLQVTALEPDSEMHAVLLARLALREDLQASVSPVPRPAGFELGKAFEICTCFSVLHLLFGDIRFQHFSSRQRLPGGLWQTVWRFTASRSGNQLDEAEQAFTWRASSAKEVQALLADAGLVTGHRFSGFDGGPFVDGDSPALLAVARKPLRR